MTSSEELDLPKIPKRSRLYHLEPVAIGTPYVEGLISYICRLAEAHCVSPRVLIQKEILPSFRKRYCVGAREIYELQKDGDTMLVSSIPKPIYQKNPNEYGLLAWQYLEGLKPLTMRQDLEALIIPPTIEKSLQGSLIIASARAMRAWCPECFQTWQCARSPLYEPLLWSIAAIVACPYHYKPLQSHCPHCRRSQRPLTARTFIARCSKCSGWLGVRAETITEPDYVVTTDIESHLQITEQIMRLLIPREDFDTKQ